MTVVVQSIYYHFKVTFCHGKRLLFPCKRQKEQGTVFNWTLNACQHISITIVHFRTRHWALASFVFPEGLVCFTSVHQLSCSGFPDVSPRSSRIFLYGVIWFLFRSRLQYSAGSIVWFCFSLPRGFRVLLSALLTRKLWNVRPKVENDQKTRQRVSLNTWTCKPLQN